MTADALRVGMEQLVGKWREQARVSHEEAGRIRRTIHEATDAEERCLVRTEVWFKCADDLATLLAVGDRPQHEDTKDDPSRVETPATIPSAGSTAQSATGDTSSRQTTLRDALADLRQLVKTEAGHIAYFDEELDAVVAAALRQGSQAPRNHEDLIAAVIDHWFIQGGEARFGPIVAGVCGPVNEDELVARILALVSSHDSDRPVVDRPPAEPLAWQPIATAPKDQTEILVFHGGEYMTVVWWDELLTGWIVGALADQSIYVKEPTHWRPLPAQPAARLTPVRLPTEPEMTKKTTKTHARGDGE